MTLDSEQKRQLKAQAHKLNPIILIGAKGLTESVLLELDHALLAHELVKIKMAQTDREIRAETIMAITVALDAELIQSIGRTATFFRANT